MQANRPVALLVGAGDAIGAAVARRFAAEKFQVCVARRDAAKAQKLIDEVSAAGGSVRAFSVDARQESEIQALFATVERDVGPIEVCLYNAGSNVNTPLVETTGTLFRKAWELACYGGFLTGREAARYMVPRGTGTILFTGATASMRGGPGFAAFASAKFGLRAVAQSMARELGPKNIHVGSSRDRRRRGQRSDPQAHAGPHRRRRRFTSAGQPDPDTGDCRRLLDAAQPAAQRLDA
jgi:NAD(P)-dependent dehydrogenase (short-subunit alcohol dehydrogenase family)